MQNFKERLDNNMPKYIEKIGAFINPLLLNFRNENNQLLIFYFHGLFESVEQKKLNHIDPQNNMTVIQFIEFIEYFLAHKYKFIIPEDLHTDLKSDVPYAMITFDDGYFNNMLAIEIMKKYSIPAVFFITTKNVKENLSFWWDIIFKYRAKQGINIEAIRREQRSLKGFKHPTIESYIVQNFGIEAFKPWSDFDRPFNENEVRNISKSPYVSIGNHTHNHSILTNYNREEIKEELSESNNILLDMIGKLPITTAFPNGNYCSLVLEVAAELGFLYAFTTEPRHNYLPVNHKSLICLNRFMTNTAKIRKYGGFYRLGYEPELFYADYKEKIKSRIRRK
jgi:peptidoglycan/xylan/chitin deacetylase (PgdA/CDA1 family)